MKMSKKKTALSVMLFLAGTLGLLTALQAAVDVTIDKKARSLGSEVAVGVQFAYDLQIFRGVGADPAEDVVVTDVLPDSVTLVSAETDRGTCSGTKTITCNLGDILSEFELTPITIIVTPNEAGPLSNTATVTSASADPDLSNNSSTETFEVASNGGGCQLIRLDSL